MTERRQNLHSSSAIGAVAQNVDALGTDLTPSRPGPTRFRICVSGTAVELSIVPSSGSAIPLNGGAALAAAYHEEVVSFDTSGGRTFNLQTPNIAGITINELVVDELLSD